jgi:outer membrane protein OmpA-like peptidoglycan-associated protein
LIGTLLAALAGCAAPPQPVAPPPPGAPVVYGPRIVLTIEFNFDSARIRPEYYPTLDNLAAGLADPSLAGARLDINGHTDVTGRFGYNVALSMRRAESVVNYLAARGVPRETMNPQGFGPLQLIDPENPRSPANRRVEVVAVH